MGMELLNTDKSKSIFICHLDPPPEVFKAWGIGCVSISCRKAANAIEQRRFGYCGSSCLHTYANNAWRRTPTFSDGRPPSLLQECQQTALQELQGLSAANEGVA